MKLCRYDDDRLGVVIGDQVHDVTQAQTEIRNSTPYTAKVDPVVALGLPFAGRPIVRIIHIRSMVEEHTYRRFRLSFLRIHRQAVMGNERRYFYDYYMLCRGPLPLRDWVEHAEQAVAAFAGDGTLVETASIDEPVSALAVPAREL